MSEGTTMPSKEFRIVYRTVNELWNDFDTASGQQIIFEAVSDAEVIVQHLVSMDGVIEGVILNEKEEVVQQWRAGPWGSMAELVEDTLDERPQPN